MEVLARPKWQQTMETMYSSTALPVPVPEEKTSKSIDIFWTDRGGHRWPRRKHEPPNHQRAALYSCLGRRGYVRPPITSTILSDQSRVHQLMFLTLSATLFTALLVDFNVILV